MLRIEMLPAAHGDCLWIEYGSGDEVHRILIDGGPAHTYPALRERILHLPSGARRFDLLIVSHIDADHVEGILRLLQDAEALHCVFDRIWFNGRDQLNEVPDPAGKALGSMEGEVLGVLIADYEKRAGQRVWNAGIAERIAAVDRASGGLPTADLPGECRLTILSPDLERLLDLKDHWASELRRAGVKSGDVEKLRAWLEGNRGLRPLGDVLGADDDPQETRFELPAPNDADLLDDLADALGSGTADAKSHSAFGSDTSRTNGSSIAVLLEYPSSAPSVRLLLAADAWPSVLEASIRALAPRDEYRLPLTALKLPHHGSVGNLSPSLLASITCTNYLVSTSGALFRHPHPRAIELLLSEHEGRGKPCIRFNYLTSTTERWGDPVDQKKRGYAAVHPKGISIEL